MRAFGRSQTASADHIQHHVEQLPCLHCKMAGQHAQSCAGRIADLFPMSDHDETGSAVLLNKIREGTGALCIGSRSPTRFAKTWIIYSCSTLQTFWPKS